MSTLKSVKGGKTDDSFEEHRITLRGTEYTIRELSVPEYKDCLKAATDEKTGLTPFSDLLDLMVLRSVSPSLAARSTPISYPVYRTLEDLVNTTHFITLEDENKPPAKPGEDEPETEGEEEPEAVAPNS